MRTIDVPAEVERMMNYGATLAISISGGKDGQAMATALLRLAQERGWSKQLVLVHADLGRIEWKQTPGHVRRIAQQTGIPLEIVRRRNGQGRWDMVDRWVDRAETLKAAGKQPRPWSDAGNRFCTSELKRDPINTLLRKYDRVISAEGLRAQESRARARKPVVSRRERICAAGREALTWYPILSWTLDDVLQELGSSISDLELRREAFRAGQTDQALAGWAAHPVYVMGNERLSCAFCVLGCKGDLENAARHNPELLTELVGIEQRYGFKFQQSRSLESLQAATS